MYIHKGPAAKNGRIKSPRCSSREAEAVAEFLALLAATVNSTVYTEYSQGYHYKRVTFLNVGEWEKLGEIGRKPF
jgi:hypothetical protein